jgi:hypothetical protein
MGAPPCSGPRARCPNRLKPKLIITLIPVSNVARVNNLRSSKRKPLFLLVYVGSGRIDSNVILQGVT